MKKVNTKNKFQELKVDILSIDVGAKTQDTLLYNGSYENCFKLILPSASYRLFHNVKKYTKEKKNLIITGEVMGGGPFKIALFEHIKNGLKVYMTSQSAKSIKDNLDEVKKTGIEIISEDKATEILNDKSFAHIKTNDIDIDTLRYFLEKNGFTFSPKIVAVAVQDHGYAGPDENDNITRFRLFKNSIPGRVSDFGFTEPPHIYSRMCGVKNLLKKHFPDSRYLIMDSKIAGIFGALYGTQIQTALVIEVGNAHTTAALIKNEEIISLFEHHTGIILKNPSKLKYFVDLFIAGKLTNQEIIDDGGHGCYVSTIKEISNIYGLPILVTGPNRTKIENSGLQCEYAMPNSDVMIAGNIGLVECCKKIF
jgi:uncharacterized protein (DUF1786 family)